MYKKISRHGNNLAIIIDKALLEMLSIDENTLLKISTDGKNIIIEPVHTINNDALAKDPKLLALFNEITEQYSEDLKKLADS
jgi:antitoxin component of MazEF toxin-antitoxin module